MPNAVYWNNQTHLPLYGITLDRLLYRIKQDDTGLMLDACSFEDIYEDSDGVLALDAMVTPYAYLERKMAAMQRVLNAQGGALKVDSSAISEPFSANGTVNVVVRFLLSDGQTISVYFHNPDTTPKKVSPTDEMISWRWLINKRDVTVVVAPERGRDLNVNQVAARLMKLAAKNSAAFARANAKIADNAAQKTALQAEITQLEGELETAKTRLEAVRAGRDKSLAETNDGVLTYEQFKAEYQALLNKMMTYSSDQAGSNIYAGKMADLVAKYPDYESRYDDEIDGNKLGINPEDKETAPSPAVQVHPENSATSPLNDLPEPTDNKAPAKVARPVKTLTEARFKKIEGDLFKAVMPEIKALSLPKQDAEKAVIYAKKLIHGNMELLPFGNVSDFDSVKLNNELFEKQSLNYWNFKGDVFEAIEGALNEKTNDIYQEIRHDEKFLSPAEKKQNELYLKGIADYAINTISQLSPGATDFKVDFFTNMKQGIVHKNLTDVFESPDEADIRITYKNANGQTVAIEQSLYDGKFEMQFLTEEMANEDSSFEGGVAPSPAVASSSIEPEGKDNEVRTAKGTKIITGFTVVEASRLVISHDEQGNANPNYPAELQPRDRSRDTSQLQIAKIANNLDPDMLGRTRVAYQGAPIVGQDGVVESGNGRAMAIKLAYELGKADEYRNWLVEVADMYGLDPEKIQAMKQPVLVRVRKTDVDRVQFAMEANQSDMLAMTGTEKAKSDANRLTDAIIGKLSIDGDLAAASNRDFIMAFLQSLGDDETAGLLTTNGQPTKQLYDRAQAAIFAKAYNDDRLLELMADESKPEIANILRSLNQAARPFIRARAISETVTQNSTQQLSDAIETSLDQQAVDAIIKATEMLKRAKDSGMPVEELVKQQDMFGDTDPVVAQMALFIKENNRSAARLGVAFEAMAEFVLKELENRVNDSLFADDPIDMVDVLKAANEQLKKHYGDDVKTIGGGGTGGFIDIFTETRGQKAVREAFINNQTDPDPSEIPNPASDPIVSEPISADAPAEEPPVPADPETVPEEPAMTETTPEPQAEKIAAYTAELDALKQETDTDIFNQRLDDIAARIDADGLMEVMDAELNAAADVLTALQFAEVNKLLA